MGAFYPIPTGGNFEYDVSIESPYDSTSNQKGAYISTQGPETYGKR